MNMYIIKYIDDEVKKTINMITIRYNSNNYDLLSDVREKIGFKDFHWSKIK